jgi:hypothetical protein
VPTLRGIDDRELSLRAWLHETAGVILRKLRIRADPVEVVPDFVELMLRARSAARAETILRIDPDYVFGSYIERRALYTDFLTGFLLPRTTIFSGDDVMIRTNSLGCRGDEIAPGRPVIAFFGDSTTLGVMGTAQGLTGSSWTDEVVVDGYEIVNAGVEGMTMDSVARRFESLRDRAPVTCAVFYTGWHNLIYNRRTPEYWEECLESYRARAPTTVLCTLPSPLLPEMRTRGIDALLNEEPDAAITDDYFNFWGDMDPGRWLGELIDALERFNAHVIEFCRRTETPLIDLRGFLYPDAYETATRDFFDICHVRPRVYPRLGTFISEALVRLLPASPPSVAEWRPKVETPEAATEDLRRNIYPIW